MPILRSQQTMTEEINIFKCLDYIRDQAKLYAQAKANRCYLENYRKTVKALEMRKHLDKPIGAQEREAYASEAMQEVDKGIQAATEQEEQLRWLLIAAQAKCETWRTLQANSRYEAKVI